MVPALQTSPTSVRAANTSFPNGSAGGPDGMRKKNARELNDFPRLVFPDGWAVNHRQDIDPEVVSDRPSFGHRFVGVWPDIKCVPITNADGTDNIFGRNQSVTIDTVAVRTTNINTEKHIQMLKTRSAVQKRQREAPGFDKDREYRNWIANHGDVAGDLDVGSSQSYRRVTFDDQNETFGDADEATISTPIPPEKIVNNEWGVDDADSAHPSTEHRERITWRLAPSRRLIKLTEGCHRESYDMDLMPFQAGSYASDEEETEYLESEIDGNLIRGVQLEAPEEYYDITETTDKTPVQAHSTPEIDAEDLANQPEDIESTPQASVETREDTRTVESAPEIEIEFGDEPTIELSSYY